jgi:hypothetical protein
MASRNRTPVKGHCEEHALAQGDLPRTFMIAANYKKEAVPNEEPPLKSRLSKAAKPSGRNAMLTNVSFACKRLLTAPSGLSPCLEPFALAGHWPPRSCSRPLVQRAPVLVRGPFFEARFNGEMAQFRTSF